MLLLDNGPGCNHCSGSQKREREVLLPSPAALDWEAWEVSRGELGPDHMLGDRRGQADRHSSGLVLGDAHKLM